MTPQEEVAEAIHDYECSDTACHERTEQQDTATVAIEALRKYAEDRANYVFSDRGILPMPELRDAIINAILGSHKNDR